MCQVFLRRFRDPIRVSRIENRVPKIRENYHRVSRIRENRVPRIREIGSLQIHTGHLSLKNPGCTVRCKLFSVFQSNQNRGISFRLGCIYLRMPKCAYESRSNKRKKATAKADALRAVIVKTKPLIQSLVCL